MKDLIKRSGLAGVVCALLALNLACSGSPQQQETKQEEEQLTASTNRETRVVKSYFGSLEDGREVDLFTISNSKGTELKVTNYGGIITSLKVADKEGELEDVVLGFDSLSGYLQEGVPYFGAIIGRFGNRIARGKFMLDGQEYQLAVNSNGNHLHGGNIGFDKVLWEAKEVQTAEGAGVELHYLSPDMEEGYPGNLDTRVVYTLTEEDEVKIDYTATTDKKTVVNFTNHSYFNLKGHDGGDILDHKLMINADRFVPVDKNMVPTGELMPLAGTPFDFSEPKAIGKDIGADHEQLLKGNGYDQSWVLKEENNETLVLAASVLEPESGRFMEVFTTEPGVQLYTANWMNGSLKGKEGFAYGRRSALCLETQHFPDSPNQPNFPSTTLEPGEIFHSQTIYKFSVKE